MTKLFPTSDRLLRALRGDSHDRTPVWMMRQAGRYLPEYRAIRAEVPDFMTLCNTPELACEVTLQPLRRFPLDAAIIFTDILVVPAAMGMSLQFIEGRGPVFEAPIRDETAIKKLRRPTIDEALSPVMETLQCVKQKLTESSNIKIGQSSLPVFGFVGSPWTLATYMIEGETSKQFPYSRRLLYQRPELLHDLLRRISEVLFDFLVAQVKAGADVLMIFDSWGGILGRAAYQTFSLQYIERILQRLRQDLATAQVPVVIFSKGAGAYLDVQRTLNPNGIGLDWTADLAEARRCVGESITLQGNLDPFALYASPDHIQAEVKRIMEAYGTGYRHIFNLGHGIDQHTPIDHVHAMLEAVHQYGKKAATVNHS